VTVPYFYPTKKIDKILKEKEDWIRQHQLQIQLKQKQINPADKDSYLYLGRPYPLELGINQKNIIEFSDKFYLGSTNKKYAKQYLTSWYRQQARKIITERVNHYSRISGLHFQSVKITTAETRWGSCSSEKNLNFNWKLIMAPLPVIDYVVAHELAHLEELNHSRNFWGKVRKMYPLYRQYRTWLKRNGSMLTI